MKYNNILETIGRTPHVRLSKLFPKQEVWIKLEKQNPGGSIKDRIALAMIEKAERERLLEPGATIIEPHFRQYRSRPLAGSCLQRISNHYRDARIDVGRTPPVNCRLWRPVGTHFARKRNERCHRKGAGDSSRNTPFMDATTIQE